MVLDRCFPVADQPFWGLPSLLSKPRHPPFLSPVHSASQFSGFSRLLHDHHWLGDHYLSLGTCRRRKIEKMEGIGVSSPLKSFKVVVQRLIWNSEMMANVILFFWPVAQTEDEIPSKIDKRTTKWYQDTISSWCFQGTAPKCMAVNLTALCIYEWSWCIDQMWVKWIFYNGSRTICMCLCLHLDICIYLHL